VTVVKDDQAVSKLREEAGCFGSITGLLMIWGAVADKKSLHDKKKLDI
ncbi:MAG: hypothetical protein IMF02_02905, partial [Proteobacteria bacterium]|nr:hypothetical protein [Pseudomonadota bacterium]